MLKLCEELSELNFLPSDPFCAKITATAECYGFGYDFCRIYIQGENAALSSLDGNVTLWCSENADYEEIKEFFKVFPFASLQASENTFRNLEFEFTDSSYIVKYNGSEAEKPSEFADSFDLKKIYGLLCDCGFGMGNYNEFLTDVCARINKGLCRYGVIADDEIKACAFRLFEGEKSVLLGAVATNPGYRGKGLASALVPYMARGDKEAFLFCRNDSLLEFYKKCGFTQWGRWCSV